MQRRGGLLALPVEVLQHCLTFSELREIAAIERASATLRADVVDCDEFWELMIERDMVAVREDDCSSSVSGATGAPALWPAPRADSTRPVLDASVAGALLVPRNARRVAAPSLSATGFRVSLRTLPDRRLREVYQMVRTGEFVERRFEDRPPWQRGLIVAATVLLTPFLLAYMSPTIAAAVRDEGVLPAVRLWEEFFADDARALRRRRFARESVYWAWSATGVRKRRQRRFRDHPVSSQVLIALVTIVAAPYWLIRFAPAISRRVARYVNSYVLRPFCCTVVIPAAACIVAAMRRILHCVSSTVAPAFAEYCVRPMLRAFRFFVLDPICTCGRLVAALLTLTWRKLRAAARATSWLCTSLMLLLHHGLVLLLERVAAPAARALLMLAMALADFARRFLVNPVVRGVVTTWRVTMCVLRALAEGGLRVFFAVCGWVQVAGEVIAHAVDAVLRFMGTAIAAVARMVSSGATRALRNVVAAHAALLAWWNEPPSNSWLALALHGVVDGAKAAGVAAVRSVRQVCSALAAAVQFAGRRCVRALYFITFIVPHWITWHLVAPFLVFLFWALRALVVLVWSILVAIALAVFRVFRICYAFFRDYVAAPVWFVASRTAKATAAFLWLSVLRPLIGGLRAGWAAGVRGVATTSRMAGRGLRLTLQCLRENFFLPVKGAVVFTWISARRTILLCTASVKSAIRRYVADPVRWIGFHLLSPALILLRDALRSSAAALRFAFRLGAYAFHQWVTQPLRLLVAEVIQPRMRELARAMRDGAVLTRQLARSGVREVAAAWAAAAARLRRRRRGAPSSSSPLSATH